MRHNLRTLSLGLGVAGALIWGATAQAVTVSVNFGTSANNLLTTDSAGLLAATNWNNATSTATGTTANLAGAVVKDSTGASTGVGISWAGGGLTNNPSLITGAAVGTPNGKMMNHFWNTGNALVFQGLFVDTNNTIRTYMKQDTSNGAFNNTVALTNLNAAFPSGYDVYVYLSGAGTSLNEQNSGGTPGAGGGLQHATPLVVAAGPAGLISAAGSSSGTSSLEQGVDNSNINNGGTGGTTKSIMVGRAGVSSSNLPSGSQVALIWPTSQIVGGPQNGNWTTEFNGTFTTSASAFTAADAFPLDFTLSGQQGGGLNPPSADTYERIPTDNWTGKNFHDPTARGIPTGNYIKFTGLTLNNLDILARNLYGERNAAGSSGTGLIEGGGITGIQIVGAAAEAVPEPATLGMAALGLLGFIGLGWRKMRRA